MREIIYKQNSRSKSIKISINSAGKVLVSYPRWTPRFVVDKFVSAQENWIEIQLNKIKEKLVISEDNDNIHIFGKKYQKVLHDFLELPYGVTVQDGVLNVNLHGTSKKHKELLDRFLKNTAEKYIVPRTYALAKKMNLSFKNITLRQQKTRWGSCSSQKNLNFNWRLVHYLPNIIDYVIIHELAHLVHMNHSQAFWNLVRQYDPEYLKHRGFLKRCGMVLG
ncbi:MAG: M48 family metallopeptidase [Candidatus Pacebacteria bacterium]|nr:M48 family metallopeptidase [Candidatus Paceibacterota bacterium]